MQDILAATDDMMAEPYIDTRRVAAVGASFGGYTVYWLMGHHEDRFCCMISHCGVFNLESWYGSTEELFFANWDLGGFCLAFAISCSNRAIWYGVRTENPPTRREPVAFRQGNEFLAAEAFVRRLCQYQM